MRESSIEKYLYDEIFSIRGVCVKLNPRWNVGIPDRLCVFTRGTGRNSYTVIAFVETKRPKGGRVSVVQNWWKKRLTNLGCEHHIICTKKQVDQFIRGEL